MTYSKSAWQASGRDNLNVEVQIFSDTVFRIVNPDVIILCVIFTLLVAWVNLREAKG